MKETISEKEANIVVVILNKFQAKYSVLKTPIFSFKDLFKILSKPEQAFVLKLCSIDLDVVNKERPLGDNLFISATDNFSKQFVGLHKAVYTAFMKLNAQLNKETNNNLYVISGYRSPAYQLLIFLRELYAANFDPQKALRTAKLPADSEHCNYPRHAIDISINSDRNLPTSSFESTQAYKWMLQNGGGYGFKLSYPKNNLKDTIFEPWHWKYSGAN